MKLYSGNIGTLRYTVTTILILLIPIGFYFFYYLPKQTVYFTSQNLRLLGNMSQQITGKIEHYKNMLDNALIKSPSVKEIIESSRSGAKNVTAVETISELNALFKQPKIKKRIEGLIGQIEDLDFKSSTIYQGDELPFSQLNIALRPIFSPNNVQNNSENTLKDHKTFSVLRLRPELSGNNLILHAYYLGHRHEDDSQQAAEGTYTIEVEAYTKLSDIVEPFMKPDIFDSILLVEHDDLQRVIFQSSQEGFLATRFDSVANGFRESWSSQHQDITLGNKAYKLYLQPIRIGITNDYPQLKTESIEWMLVGLVDASRFHNNTRAIPHFFISSFIFFVLLILICMPFFKLHFIGTLEELKRIDLLLTVIALFVGAGVLAFLVLSVNTAGLNSDDLDEGLKPFAEEIERNFGEELDSIINQLTIIKTECKLNSSPLWSKGARRISSILTDTIFTKATIFSPERAKELPYPYFRQTAWINEDGWQTHKIGTLKNITALVDVSKRQYFKRIKDNEGWLRGNTPFFIQPIISITTGANSAVVSMADTVNDDSLSAVIASTVKFISLLETVIPEGFGFCIIDNSGQVLFHKESNRNLYENFFTECNNDQKLQSAVFSRVEKKLTVNYLGRGHRCYVKPMDGLPWTIVTFADLNLIRSSELSALSVAAFLFLILVLIATVSLLIIRMTRGAKLNDWIWPQEKLDGTYQFYTIVLFATAGVYYSEIYQLNDIRNLFYAIAFPIGITIATYILFRVRLEFPDLNVLWQELKSAFTKKTGKSTGDSEEKVPESPDADVKKLELPKARKSDRGKTIRNAIRILGLSILISTPFSLLFYSSHFYESVLYGVVMGVIGLGLSLDGFARFITGGKLPLYYTRYALSGVAFLLITSILPTIAFFKISNDSEKELFTKRSQLSLLAGIKERDIQAKKALETILPEGDEQSELFRELEESRLDYLNAKDIYSRPLFKTFVSSENDVDRFFENYFDECLGELYRNQPDSIREAQFGLFKKEIDPANIINYSPFDSCLANLRSAIKIVGFKSWDLFDHKSENDQWYWKKFNKTFLLLYEEGGSTGKNVYIISKIFPFTQPGAFLWYLGIFLIMILLFGALIFFVNKVYVFDLNLPSRLEAEKTNSKPPAFFQNTIYIGQPNSGKSQFIKKIEKVYKIDFRQTPPTEMLAKLETIVPPDQTSPKIPAETALGEKDIENFLKSEVIILDHFDLHLDDNDANKAKLQILEHLISTHKKIVVIVTTIDPTIFIPRLTDEIGGEETKSEDKKDAERKRAQQIRREKLYINRWTMALSSFVKVYHNINIDKEKFAELIYETQPQTPDENNEREAIPAGKLNDILYKECNHTPFLQRIGEEIITKFDLEEDFFNKDALIDEILQRAYAYYGSIWAVLSKTEKITLIHLAKNGFVTPKDAHTLRLLIRKGIVQREKQRSFRLMNESFKQFVLGAEPSSVVRKWEQEQEKKWGNVRTPLIIVLLAIAIFIFATQPELFNESIVWITGLAAVVPAVLRLFSLISPRGKTSNDDL